MCNILHAGPRCRCSRSVPSLLRDTVHDRLRDAIVDGTLAPGEVVRDTELATWLGVSRTPVREALLRLGGSGPGAGGARPLDRGRRDRPRRGARGPRGRGEHAPAGRGRGGRPAHHRRPRRGCARPTSASPRAIDAHDTEAALAADDDFHAVAVDASGNRALATVLDQFGPVVRRLERLRFASLAAADSVDLHDRLVAACAAGDADAAADVAFRTWQNLADLIPDTRQHRPRRRPRDPRPVRALPADLRPLPRPAPQAADDHLHRAAARRSGPSARTSAAAWPTAATRSASWSTSSPTCSPAAPTRSSRSAATSPTTPGRSPRSPRTSA